VTELVVGQISEPLPCATAQNLGTSGHHGNDRKSVLLLQPIFFFNEFGQL
jgi:hypothetical protein